LTFLEAFNLHPYDTIAISKAMGIKEHEADRLINAKMNRARKTHRENMRLASKPPIVDRGLVRFAGFDPNERSRW
jgi:hypothetical protein